MDIYLIRGEESDKKLGSASEVLFVIIMEMKKKNATSDSLFTRR